MNCNFIFWYWLTVLEISVRSTLACNRTKLYSSKKRFLEIWKYIVVSHWISRKLSSLSMSTKRICRVTKFVTNLRQVYVRGFVQTRTWNCENIALNEPIVNIRKGLLDVPGFVWVKGVDNDHAQNLVVFGCDDVAAGREQFNETFQKTKIWEVTSRNVSYFAERNTGVI